MAGTAFSKARFVSPTAHVEFLIGTLDPELLPEQQVDVCYGVHWRIEALEDVPALHTIEFTCVWENPTSGTTLDRSSGQTVEAAHWRDGLTDVCIGTIQPEEGLPAYGQLPYFKLPSSWNSLHRSEPFLTGVGVEISLSGLTINYPALLGGEVCYAQLAVAWKLRRDQDDDDTWFAVDLSPEQIIRAAYPDGDFGAP